MKTFTTYIRAILLVSFQPKLLADVAKHWKGLGVWYALLLFALCYLPVAFLLGTQIYNHVLTGEGNRFADELETVLAQFPTLTIENGQIDARDVE